MKDDEPTTLLFGHDGPFEHALARELSAELCPVATPWKDVELDTWGREQRGAPAVERIVVAPAAAAAPSATALVDLDASAWHARAEQPFLIWSVLLGAAARRVAKGGAIVAVVEAPAPLDAAGFAPELGLARAVHAWVRSIASAEGKRGVRANTVVTPARLPSADVKGPAPPLPSFPGRVEHEVAGAVRSLLADDARGITGTRLVADGGRAW